MTAPRRILTAVAVAAAVTLLAAAAGCGGQAGPTGPAGPGTPSGGDVVTSGPMPPVTASPSAPPTDEVVPEPAVDLAAVRWQRVEPVAGASALLVHGTLTGGPPCAVVSRVDVAETSRTVTVTVWVGRRADAACDGPQPDLGHPYVTRVALAAPVAGREVRDGAR